MTDQSLPGEQQEAAWSSGDPTIATSGAAWVRGSQWGDARGHARRRRARRTPRCCSCASTRPARSPRSPARRRLQRFGRLRSVTSARNGDLLVTTDNGVSDRVLRVSPR